MLPTLRCTAGTCSPASGIRDPYPHYAALRELGPVVWLSRQRVYALPRYAECKAVLRDDANFISGQGVALNPVTNRLSGGTTLNSDGDDHQRRRKLLAHRLTPKALRSMSEAIDAKAEASSRPRSPGATSTGCATWRWRCHWRWCQTWWGGPRTAARTC